MRGGIDDGQRFTDDPIQRAVMRDEAGKELRTTDFDTRLSYLLWNEATDGWRIARYRPHYIGEQRGGTIIYRVELHFDGWER